MARLRSYLLKTTYDWLVEHELTPYFEVDAAIKGVTIPVAYVEEGQITLDASPEAVRNFVMTDTEVSFKATFSGEEYAIRFPIEAIIALIAKETEQGLYQIDLDEFTLAVDEGDAEHLDPHPNAKPLSRGHFKIVK